MPETHTVEALASAVAASDRDPQPREVVDLTLRVQGEQARRYRIEGSNPSVSGYAFMR